MFRVLHGFRLPLARGLRSLVLLTSAILLAACSGGTGGFSLADLLSSSSPSTPAQPSTSIGTGTVKVGFILPLSGTGNASVAAQSMRNASEMALAEFNSPDIRLLVKDDAGSAPVGVLHCGYGARVPVCCRLGRQAAACLASGRRSGDSLGLCGFAGRDAAGRLPARRAAASRGR